MKNANRFAQGSAVYTCIICAKATRETGNYESEFEMCKRCLFANYVENAESDYGVDSPQYAEAVAKLATI
jgi:hypothetical protein